MYIVTMSYAESLLDSASLYWNILDFFIRLWHICYQIKLATIVFTLTQNISILVYVTDHQQNN